MAEIRWKCDPPSAGCYLTNLHAPIHLFDDCFGGRIEMSDIDGVVERRQKFLFLEWKVPPGGLTKGQEILFEQLTLGRGADLVVYLVIGPVDPEPNTVIEVCKFNDGSRGECREMTLDDLRAHFRAWYNWADGKTQIPPVMRHR